MLNVWKRYFSKCDIFQREVPYLGHVVSESAVSTDPDKVATVSG